MSLPGYDAWATRGRYDRQDLYAICPTCETETAVVAETEYGTTTWDVGHCPHCGDEYPEDTPWREMDEYDNPFLDV